MKHKGVCLDCAGTGKAVNPAWLMWKRKHHGVTQQHIARQLQCSRQFIWQLEHGVKGLRITPRIVAVYEAL